MVKKRIAIVHQNRCQPNKCQTLCQKLCPVNRTGKECLTITQKARIDELLCTGCGICQHRCPFSAIDIINLPHVLNKTPCHRYGENQFELFSLPVPLFGKITGLLGGNALGKSTAFKILAGILKPNLGNYQNPPSFQEVITHFRGSELQIILEKIRDKKICFSYKPQQIDLIPKAFSGTVKELLEQFDERKVLQEIIKRLELTNFWETSLSEISGGELQKTALAVAVLKSANIYLFDEPSSYLDIKQRIKIASFLQSLSNPQTAIMIIEHDLILFDYLTDLINIIYGKPACYGVISGLKSTREGINAFLEGYLKEENLRFRSDPLKFLPGSKKEGGTKEILLRWRNLRKRLGQFQLETSEGEFYRREIIGILGENGIGKTTFIKILAGLIKPEAGFLNRKIKVAYKPQYLKTTSNQQVKDFLKKAIDKYYRQLLVPLNMEKIFTKPLSHLSGGELQKVSLVYCLSQEADLFLLDEPCAYLDVEQRLLIAKIIRKFTEERELTVVIVDHDLMFLDYLSDRLIIFQGKPAQKGFLQSPLPKEQALNSFLRDISITLRKDPLSNRPRINKKGSVKDREQREKNQWYCP